MVESKRGQEIVECIQGMIGKGNKPLEFITDDGKEICNQEFREMCSCHKIRHTTVGVESDRRNGRVERVIMTIRDGLRKSEKSEFERKVGRIQDQYNRTHQSGIGRRPLERWNDETGWVMMENSLVGKCSRKFKKGFMEKFEIGQDVRVGLRENLGKDTQRDKGRFTSCLG